MNKADNNEKQRKWKEEEEMSGFKTLLLNFIFYEWQTGSKKIVSNYTYDDLYKKLVGHSHMKKGCIFLSLKFPARL